MNTENENIETPENENVEPPFEEVYFLCLPKKKLDDFVYFERYVLDSEPTAIKWILIKEIKRKKIEDLFTDTFDQVVVQEPLISFLPGDYKTNAQEINKKIKLHPKIPYKHCDFLIKEIKRRLVCSAKTWEETMSQDERKWIWEQLMNLSITYNTPSNFRAAKSNKNSQIRRYKRQKAKNREGGFFDTKVKDSNGVEYLLGFNYART
jgi:hypothetical protein